MKQYLFAIATFVGTIVGAGIFGIPFVVARAGIFSGLFYFFFAGTITLIICWLYGEVILRTKKTHRLVGYAHQYLGKKGKWVASFSTIFGFFGSLLAYLILGGDFLRVLLGDFLDWESIFFVLLFFALGALVIFVGLGIICAAEFFMTLLLLFVVGLLSFKGYPHLQFSNFSFFDHRYLFLAYGVIFYSFLGSSALPEMRQILRGREKFFKPAILWGLVIVAVVYLVFSFSVVGITGQDTTVDAISGLVPLLGGSVIKIGALFGFLAVFSSFIVIGLSLKKVFNFDFGLNKHLSWLLVVSVPLALFLVGIQSFIFIIGIIGIVMGGIEGVLLILIYKKADTQGDRRPEYDVFVPKTVLWLLAVIFISGMVYQLLTL